MVKEADPRLKDTASEEPSVLGRKLLSVVACYLNSPSKNSSRSELADRNTELAGTQEP